MKPLQRRLRRGIEGLGEPSSMSSIVTLIVGSDLSDVVFSISATLSWLVPSVWFSMQARP